METLSSGAAIWMLAPAGSGKSTLLRHTTIQLLQVEELALFFPAKLLAKQLSKSSSSSSSSSSSLGSSSASSPRLSSSSSPCSALRHSLEDLAEAFQAVSHKMFKMEELLLSKQVILIVDGLDEVSPGEQKTHLLDLISTLAKIIKRATSPPQPEELDGSNSGPSMHSGNDHSKLSPFRSVFGEKVTVKSLLVSSRPGLGVDPDLRLCADSFARIYDIVPLSSKEQKQLLETIFRQWGTKQQFVDFGLQYMQRNAIVQRVGTPLLVAMLAVWVDSLSQSSDLPPKLDSKEMNKSLTLYTEIFNRSLKIGIEKLAAGISNQAKDNKTLIQKLLFCIGYICHWLGRNQKSNQVGVANG